MQTLFASFVFLFLSLSCNTADPPPPPPTYVRTIEITIDDVGVTEAWLRVHFVDTTQTGTFKLLRDGQLVLNGLSATGDTLLLEDSLSPNRTYRYKAYRLIDTMAIDSSGAAFVTTLDTTSHSFAFWDIDTLGDGSSNVLYDVAVVNENDVWAAGEIYLANDTTGIPYNAARWDGIRWNLLRIPFPVFCGPSTFPSQTSAVFAFGANDVWISSGITIMRWNGSSYSALCIPTNVAMGTIREIWGTSPNSVYCVGDAGTIVHYNGTSWEMMQSGTSLHLVDIFGVSSNEIYACGAGQLGIGVVLHFDGTSWTKMIDSYSYGSGFDSSQLFKTQLYGSLSGLWRDEVGSLYVVGQFIYQHRNGHWRYLPGVVNNKLGDPGFSRGYVSAIRGNGANDLVFAGKRQTVRHHNGATSEQIGELFNFNSSFDWYGEDMKGGSVVVVGRIGARGAVIRLHR